MIGLTTFERRQNIVRLLEEQPGMRVADFAETFQVSEGTIRNDLNALEEAGKLVRVRGGAVLTSTPDGNAPEPANPPDSVANADLKQRIARWAAETVEEGDTIFMDASSTVRFMVPYLRECKRLTIVTNGLETAARLARETPHPVVMVGGMVNRSGNATTSLIGLPCSKT
jgi:DeoR/GlpR family transcriptional regulator of sugar metabolism